MMTNPVLQAQKELVHLTRLYRDTDHRLAMLIAERSILRADLVAARQRYQDALEAPRLRADGAAAVVRAEMILTDSWRETWPWGEDI